MKKYLVLCIVSAGLGVWLSDFVRQLEPAQPVVAQEGLGAQPTEARVPAGRPAVAPPPAALPANSAAATDDFYTPEERTNIAVYESANRGVVNINTKSVRNDSFLLMESPTEGAGSGSVLDKQGHILTNFHVVDGAQSIEVTLASGNTYSAGLVGKDLIDDVAVLKIDAPAADLVPLTLGESSHLRVGQRVFAIGNPFGLERTLTTGIVSSLNRTLPSRSNHRVMKSMIQLDAAMNPGNSGGPLIDTRGRVIGMNTAIASRTGQNTGVGFAIPVNRIKRVLPELIQNGYVTRPEIGISQVLESVGCSSPRSPRGGPPSRLDCKAFVSPRKRSAAGPSCMKRNRSIGAPPI